MSTRRRRSADQREASYALELVDVSKVYEVGGMELTALDHVDLVVAYNEVVTLLGPSGSGKTTLLSIAGGLLTATDGRVVVDGRDITHASARKLTSFRRRQVGFIFQAVNLVPFLTARENLLVVAELAGRDRSKAKRRADQLLDELGLAHRMANLPVAALGRRAAAGRHRAGADERAGPGAGRRADLGPRLRPGPAGHGADRLGGQGPGRGGGHRDPRRADDQLRRPGADHGRRAHGRDGSALGMDLDPAGRARRPGGGDAHGAGDARAPRGRRPGVGPGAGYPAAGPPPGPPPGRGRRMPPAAAASGPGPAPGPLGPPPHGPLVPRSIRGTRGSPRPPTARRRRAPSSAA